MNFLNKILFVSLKKIINLSTTIIIIIYYNLNLKIRITKHIKQSYIGLYLEYYRVCKEL